MTKAGKRDKARKNGRAKGAAYVFRLFVVGNESNSTQARDNLAKLCEEHLEGRYRIETVDILENVAAARKNNVLVTPTLLLLKPFPQVTLFGNLSDTRQVVAALRLNGGSR